MLDMLCVCGVCLDSEVGGKHAIAREDGISSDCGQNK